MIEDIIRTLTEQIDSLMERFQEVVAERNDYRSLAKELLEAYEDACWQGSGNEPLSSPGWHNFLSVYEEADELIPRARAVLRAETDALHS